MTWTPSRCEMSFVLDPPCNKSVTCIIVGRIHPRTDADGQKKTAFFYACDYHADDAVQYSVDGSARRAPL